MSRPVMKPPSSVQTSEFDSSDEEPIEDEQTPIDISWLSLSRVNCSQFLGLCALPGCKFRDVRRNIQKDTDGGTPDIASCCDIMEELEICLKNNRKTLIHCYGGLGRSCLVAACLLLYLSDTVSPQQAIDSLRDLRGSGAIQTIRQYNYLHEFRDKLAAHLSSRGSLSRSVSR
ncbi:cyclin-dependent kinase inhibitor 3 isoform X4 [Mesoplodon densirostris]|uniref:cyclin-dependent kinase inhibitor 3 isoform X4 n=1 Tax=Mesoplodon densirostris TaxID=48708 RepID=UPI0028DC757A|nr:cyclin-dependent kinase inhibitor 3 isoform X4 [Mesoplodon densirostris]